MLNVPCSACAGCRREANRETRDGKTELSIFCPSTVFDFLDSPRVMGDDAHRQRLCKHRKERTHIKSPFSG